MLTKTRTASFIRHYVEMVVVMFAGMIVLGLPGEAALHAIGSGTSELRNDAPTLVFLGMAFTMTAPMVAWMRYRGHRFHRAAGCRGRTARFAGRAGCLACAALWGLATPVAAGLPTLTRGARSARVGLWIRLPPTPWIRRRCGSRAAGRWSSSRPGARSWRRS